MFFLKDDLLLTKLHLIHFYDNSVSQVRARAGTRATETTGTRDTVTRATATVDTVVMEMTTILVTMDMDLDMTTVRTDVGCSL